MTPPSSYIMPFDDMVDTCQSSGMNSTPKLKASENIAANDLKSLKALAEEQRLKRYLCVSLKARRRQVGDVTILPLKDFLAHLWDGTYT
ncbi:hypothetical protein [Nitrospira moscoviensis]|uniref:Uncharacterized protein n=1 Tax=Nitrospira moscoviensis TaxID=42253 RepID=A0A0K2G7Y7_NITMO|nr:hypothetical protein [Nitrospira moscoviensis]ALA57045.1 hypothetical protein NITMOv2_0609 [Nitrospira moscoviensis]